MKKIPLALAVFGLGLAVSAQSLGAPTNPFSSNGAPDVLGAASTGRPEAPTWNNQPQLRSQTPGSGATQTLTGKVFLDAWGTVGLTVGAKRYVLTLPSDTVAALRVKNGDTLTIEGQVLQARTGNVSMVLVSKAYAGGRSANVSQPLLADRRGSPERDDREEWDDRD